MNAIQKADQERAERVKANEPIVEWLKEELAKRTTNDGHVEKKTILEKRRKDFDTYLRRQEKKIQVKKDKFEKAETKRRENAFNHWAGTAIETKKELYDTKVMKAKKKKELINEKKKFVEKEKEDFKLQLIEEEMGTKDHETSDTAGLGVYGMPMTKGEWGHVVPLTKDHAGFNLTGGDKAGLDDCAVKIFTGGNAIDAQHTRMEQYVQDKVVEEARLNKKLIMLQRQQRELEDEKRTLREHGLKIVEDVVQLDYEEAQLHEDLAGPPRRDPGTS